MRRSAIRPKHLISFATVAVAISISAAACSSDVSVSTESAESNQDATVANDEGAATEGIRLVTAAEGADIQANAPEDLVILDVRTPEEFAEGHIEGAIMIDFYSDDFADQIADLDPDVPYLLYCRSGNRSGQTTALMQEFGFADVADVDGGIVSWAGAGLPTVN